MVYPQALGTHNLNGYVLITYYTVCSVVRGQSLVSVHSHNITPPFISPPNGAP